MNYASNPRRLHVYSVVIAGAAQADPAFGLPALPVDALQRGDDPCAGGRAELAVHRRAAQAQGGLPGGYILGWRTVWGKWG